jgi:predicted DNA-binding transcriptional regulator AlpA
MKLEKVDISEMPDWPYGMSAPLAASFCGISVTTFKLKVLAGEAPKPVAISNRRVVWRRRDLQAWLDGLPESGHDDAILGTGGAHDKDRSALSKTDASSW